MSDRSRLAWGAPVMAAILCRGWDVGLTWSDDSGGYVGILDGSRPPLYPLLVDSQTAGYWAAPGELDRLILAQSAAWVVLVAVVARRSLVTAWGLALLSPWATWERVLQPMTLAAAIAGVGAMACDRRPWLGGALLTAATLCRVELVLVLAVAAVARGWRVAVPGVLVFAGWCGFVYGRSGRLTLSTFGDLNRACAVYNLWDRSDAPFAPLIAAEAARWPERGQDAVARVIPQLWAMYGGDYGRAFAAVSSAAVDLAVAHPATWARNAAEGLAVPFTLPAVDAADFRGEVPPAPPWRRLVDAALVTGLWLHALLVRRSWRVVAACAVVLAMATTAHVAPRYLVPLLGLLL